MKRLGVDLPLPTVKGLYIKWQLDKVKGKIGEDGLKELKRELGDVRISPFDDYPQEVLIDVQRAIIRRLFGEESEESWSECGKFMLGAFLDSVLGKTTMLMLGKDPKRLALAAPKVFAHASAGMRIEVEDLGPCKVRIVISHTLHQPAYFSGIFHAALAHYNCRPSIHSQILSKTELEFLVEWS